MELLEETREKEKSNFTMVKPIKHHLNQVIEVNLASIMPCTNGKICKNTSLQ
jgi:hypothetical protein